jgi:hypothetical protein
VIGGTSVWRNPDAASLIAAHGNLSENTNMKTPDPLHTVLCFAAQLDGPPMRQAYELGLTWNKKFGFTLSSMASEHSNLKFLKFANAARKLEVGGFSNETHITVFSSPGHIDEGLHGECYDSLFDLLYDSVVLDFPSCSCPFLSNEFLLMAKEFGTTTRPYYGFACERSFDLGPAYFAIGVEQGEVSDEEGESIAGWFPGKQFGYIAHGFIRDVFRWSCLSPAHLARKIEGTTLDRWIAAESYRGKLKLFVADTWTWEVEEKHIAGIRRALKQADIIFDHMKHLQTPAAHYHEQGVRGELGYENVAARVFLELGIPTEVKPAPKTPASIFVEPHLAPSDPDENLRYVLKEMGYESEEDVQVIKSLGEGKTKELSKDEILQIMHKNKKKDRKPRK